MLDLDRDTLYDVPVPQWALTFGTGGNGHGYGFTAISTGGRRGYRGLANSNKVWNADLDEDDPRDIDSSHWRQLPNLANFSEGFTNFGNMVAFPDRHSRLYIDLYSNQIDEMADNESVWKTRWNSANGISASVGAGAVAHYNPIKKKVIFGGGATDPTHVNNHFWTLDATGTVKQVTDWNGPTYIYSIGGSGDLSFIDPVSGKLVVVSSDNQVPASATRFDVREFDFDANTWTRRTDVETSLSGLSGFSQVSTPHTVAALISVPLPDMGVILFFNPQKVFMMKYTANTNAAAPPK
jgi:hypothetical protein